MKIGLVLEGGGMRGIYTIGVLDYFMEKAFLPDYIVGVSAGADNGMSYASGQVGRGYHVIMDYIRDKRYVSLKNFIRTKSMFGMDFIFDEIPHQLNLFDYETLMAAPCEYVVGVTDMESGRPAYFGKESLDHDTTVLRASSALPVFSQPVEYKGRRYLDGGTSDPIPVEKAFEDGCDRVIVVLTRDRGFEKKPEGFGSVYRRAYREYPKMIEVLDKRHEKYNQTRQKLFEWEKQGKAMVIAPKQPLVIGRFEKKAGRLDAAHQLGFADARDLFGQVTDFCDR